MPTPLAGPSRHQNQNKNAKNAGNKNKKQNTKQKPAVRTSKIKRITEKQKIEALERDAMSYVGLFLVLALGRCSYTV